MVKFAFCNEIVNYTVSFVIAEIKNINVKIF